MKNSIAIIFTFIFTLFIVSPAVLSVVEENFDISILFNAGEEENNQKEISKNFDLKIPEIKNYTSLLNSQEKKNLFDNLLKKYTNISLENTFPPPKFL
jgi:hypothetical protein|tara:strand:+ start:895 stop:1188 length:294 start_codon:yes stop_codon:yes gene_type:complete